MPLLRDNEQLLAEFFAAAATRLNSVTVRAESDHLARLVQSAFRQVRVLAVSAAACQHRTPR
jgi:hypothetical protein